MPATENQPSFLGRISIRRNQIISMDGNHEQELEDLELFQKHVSDRFTDLVAPPQASEHSPPLPGAAASSNASSTGEVMLSISWLRKLVDVFLCCEAEFKAVLIMGRDPSQMTKPPLDRLLPDLLDRTVKALDICNAVSSGVESLRQCQRFAEIAVSALEQRPFGDGHVKRARKALISLLNAIKFDENEGVGGGGSSGGNHHNKSTERTWSFGRRATTTTTNNNNHNVHGGDKHHMSFRSLSMVVGKNWSAAKQIQAMCSNLTPPRGGEPTGLAMPVYIMSAVMVVVMWAMVASVPCQERGGLAAHLTVPPRQLAWAQSMVALQEKIGEEWKKKEKKGCAGLMEEMQRLEKIAQVLVEFADGFNFPAEVDKEEEVAAVVAEMADICRRMEDGLAPLQLQLREVFHRIVRSRTEILEILEHNAKVPQPLF